MGSTTGKAGGTTQRVDFETLALIKTLNYHLFKSKGIHTSQAEVIKSAINFAIAQEADFIDYISTGKVRKDSAFDTVVKTAGKPWFPYGNLVKLE